MQNPDAQEQSSLSELPLLNYRLPEQGYDEMCQRELAEDGSFSQLLREHWSYISKSLQALGAQELSERALEARRLLRNNGVSYNAYGDPQGRDRPWELDLIPLPIASQEWIEIERGLMQRAELLNLLLKDIYGNGEVFRKNLLPLELIYSHPGFLRPCMHLEVPKDLYVPMYAADLVRSNNGQFYVIKDRTEAPPGAGYALENRMVISRVFPSLFRDAHTHRLAKFFRTVRQTLSGMAWNPADDIRIVVLSENPDSETYFEQAYLSKYLGYTLVQGGDLTVRSGKVWLKTLYGLQPVDVILRYVAGGACDPLELQASSYSGVAGLMQAARMQNVAIVNPIGSGVLENPALLQFMPALSRHFLGEELLLESPPTLWCGAKTEREQVLANLDKYAILRTSQARSRDALYPARMEAPERAALIAQIKASPLEFVAQEELPRSTIPVFHQGDLEARPMMLRTFLVAGDSGYQVMPGGLTRVSALPDATIQPEQNGGMTTKDTWVLASEPEKGRDRSFASTPLAHVDMGRTEMPSRVAENLFWLGRYAERSESATRLLRTVFLYVVEPPEFHSLQSNQVLHRLLQTVTHLTETYPGFTGETPEAEALLNAPESELLSVFLDDNRVGSLAYNLNSLLYAARVVRDRISPDISQVFMRIEESLGQLKEQAAQLKPDSDFSDVLNEGMEMLDHLISAFAAFSGLVSDSMTHGQGWHFLMIGRRLERAQLSVFLLEAMLGTQSEGEDLLLESLLHTCDSSMTYRSRYRSQVQLMPVLDLLLQDETNPRALSFQLERLQYYISLLPRDSIYSYKSQEERLIMEALTQLRLAEPKTLMQQSPNDPERPAMSALFKNLKKLLPQLSDAITTSYFSHADTPQQLVSFENETISV